LIVETSTSRYADHSAAAYRLVDAGEVVPAVGGAQADRGDLRWDAAPGQFPDLADGVLLRAAGAGGQGTSG
jgi:hypothetical protein